MKKKATLALIGGTGKVGRHIAAEALRYGCTVRMLVRDPKKMVNQKNGIEMIEGTVENAAAIRSLLKDCQVVINTFGQPVKEPPLYSSVTKNVLVVMEELGVNRYIGVTGGSLTLQSDQKKVSSKIGARMFELIYSEMMKDKKKEAEVLSCYKSIDWTLLRLPFVLEREKITGVKVNLEDMPGVTIGNKDIAQFIVSQINGKSYIHKTPFIAN